MLNDGKPGQAKRKLSPQRFALFSIVALAIVLVFLEFVSAAILLLRPGIFGGHATSLEDRNTGVVATVERLLENRPDSLAEFHSELGWRPRVGVDNGRDNVNNQALRSRRDYSETPAAGVLRIAAFGDSFVYGSEVETDAAWARVIEESRPNVEVLNYGVPGYGQDQIYLRFLAEARDLSPTVVLLGVATPTLSRIMMRSVVFRNPSAPSYDFLEKPRFLLEGDGLELVPNSIEQLGDFGRYREDPSSIRELGEYAYWYEPLVYENWLFEYTYIGRLVFGGWANIKRRFVDPERPLKGPRGGGVFNEASSGFLVLTRIFDQFAVTAVDWNMRPVLLILPDGYSTLRMRNGQPGIMDPVRKYCEEEGLEFIDIKDAFLAQPKDADANSWFKNGFHYSAEGNRIAAEWIQQEIDRRGW